MEWNGIFFPVEKSKQPQYRGSTITSNVGPSTRHIHELQRTMKTHYHIQPSLSVTTKLNLPPPLPVSYLNFGSIPGVQVKQQRLKKLKMTEFNNYLVEHVNKTQNDFTHITISNNDTQCTQNNLAGFVIPTYET
jgi:hypothetical protein